MNEETTCDTTVHAASDANLQLLFQTSMNVTLTMVAVVKYALTQRDHLDVAAEVGIT